jgi:hypothetical protein
MTQGIAPKPRENEIANAWRAKDKASKQASLKKRDK